VRENELSTIPGRVERFTELLSNPHWRPDRAHVEGLRNLVRDLHAHIERLNPLDEALQAAVQSGMNAECPVNMGITKRGAELAIRAVVNFLQKAQSV
jgi:hypothetical protein